MQRLPSVFWRSQLTHLIRCYSSTDAQIEEKYFFKQPLDRTAAQLMQKHESDIIYSSYVENIKKPLRYTHRLILRNLCEHEKKRKQYEEAIRKPFSLALKYTKNSLKQPAGETKEQEVQENEISETSNDINLDNERDMSRDVIMNEQKMTIFRELSRRQRELEGMEPKYPAKWMQDYETYEENDDDELLPESEYGTPDPSVPISNIPCHGCGAPLQCADTSIPGYLPSELMRNQKDSMLRTIVCQRCHFLKNYNIALQLKVDPEEYIRMISAIKDQHALVILMVDLTDFPCSIWPGLVEIIGPSRPVFVVGNKVDLLPQDSKRYLDNIKNCLENNLIQAGFTQNNIKHTCLVSAETNYGIEDLITNLHKVWSYDGDVYLVGCTNVGKSTLFNALLRSDYCKAKASNIIKRATASIWPGTTLKMLKFPILRMSHVRFFERMNRLNNIRRKLGEQRRLKKYQVMSGYTPQSTLIGHLGRTFSEHREEVNDPFNSTPGVPDLFINEKNKDYVNSKWFYDTPGVVQKDQIIDLLTAEELLDVIPKKVLLPRIFLVKPNQTLMLAGLGRIDFIGGSDNLRLGVYASKNLPIVIVNTDKAEEVYQSCLGTELLRVPRGSGERLENWPGLERHEKAFSVSNYESEHKSVCDILLSSAGWVSVNLPRSEAASFHIWTPEKRGIFIRNPALLPYGAVEYRGNRIYRTPAYTLRVPRGLRN